MSIIALVFIAIYALIVFPNHYCFRTFALDLGVYSNALYDYARFRMNDAASFKMTPLNLLSDHMDLSLMILSPFSLIFGQYTLLIWQIISVITGGFGVYHLLLAYTGDKRLSALAGMHMFLFFGIFSALSFDYHSNVYASMLIPWFLLNLRNRRYLNSILLFCAIIISKESVALWMSGVCLGAMIEFRNIKKTRRILFLMGVFSLLYFIAAVMFIMPYFSPNGTYTNFKYHVLGGDYWDVLKTLLKRPGYAFRMLFINFSGNVNYDWIKTEWYVFITLSGLILMIFRPAFLIMVLIPLFSRMWYDDPSIWSIDCHYSVEFASLISIAAFLFISGFKDKKRIYAAYVLCALSLGVSLRLMDHTTYKHDYNRLRIYQADHYSRPYDIQKVHRLLNAIPERASVMAQSPFLPHLAYRDKCYMLPFVKDAEYMVASPQEPVTYPLQAEEMKKMFSDSAVSGRWETLHYDEDLIVLKRKK